MKEESSYSGENVENYESRRPKVSSTALLVEKGKYILKSIWSMSACRNIDVKTLYH